MFDLITFCLLNFLGIYVQCIANLCSLWKCLFYTCWDFFTSIYLSHFILYCLSVVNIIYRNYSGRWQALIANKSWCFIALYCTDLKLGFLTLTVLIFFQLTHFPLDDRKDIHILQLISIMTSKVWTPTLLRLALKIGLRLHSLKWTWLWKCLDPMALIYAAINTFGYQMSRSTRFNWKHTISIPGRLGKAYYFKVV